MADETVDLDEKRKARGKPGAKKGRQVGSAVGPITGATQIGLTERESRALSLRLAGATLQQVADEVGWSSPQVAHEAILRSLRTILPQETRDEARRLELARLDRLELAHWPGALDATDGGESEKHGRIVLQCIQLRSKLLGLEAPVEVDVKVRHGEPVRVELFELLDAKTLAALKPFQDEMVRLSEMRAGAVEGQATD